MAKKVAKAQRRKRAGSGQGRVIPGTFDDPGENGPDAAVVKLAAEYVKTLRKRMQTQEKENTLRKDLLAAMGEAKVKHLELENDNVDWIMPSEPKLKVTAREEAE